MEPSKEYQEQIIRFRYLKEQRDMFQNQLEIVNASLNNVINTKNTVENLKEGVNEDDEVLVPIGGYVYVKASIKDTKKVLLAVSQDVVIEKDLDGASEYLEKLIEQHNQQIQFLATQIQNSDLNLQQISQNFQKSYT
ncbi:MAG: prefoldin subunit alpha [Candidatus Hermodarchaeota archaeon]